MIIIMKNKNFRKKNYKNYSYNNKNHLSGQESITEKEAREVLEFAENWYKIASGTVGGMLTPQVINNRLGALTQNSSEIDSSEELKKAFRDPLNNQKKLVGYSEFLALKDAIAKRTIAYLGNAATFDMSFHCKNIKNQTEYNSKEYREDLAIFKNIVSSFDYKNEFGIILKRMLIDDAYFGIFRTDTDQYGFQELPYTHCYLTSRSIDWGFCYDFNMSWFLQPGVCLDLYPEVMKKMYYKTFIDANGNPNYNPANKLSERNGVWGLWTQTSPLPEEGGFIAFKWNPDSYATIPFLTSLFEDAINKDVVRQLQNNQYIIASQKLLVGLLPLLKEMKSGNTKDMFAISPDLMGKYLGLLQQGLREIVVKGVPFADLKEVTYEMPSKSIYEEFNSNLAGNSGVTADFAYSQLGKTAQAIKNNSLIDMSMLEPSLKQFSLWFSSFVNSKTKKYKFKINFSGNIFDKDERLDAALKLADRGMVDFQALANAFSGDDIFGFEDKLMQSSYSPLWEKLKLLPNVHTANIGSAQTGTTSSTEASDIGRKKKEDVSEITERNKNRIVD